MTVEKCTEAINDALRDYADWVSKKAKGNYMVDSPNNLRGIFYNKLKSRLHDVGVSYAEIRYCLFPTDFICHFEIPGGIAELKIVSPITYIHNSDRYKFLSKLETALGEIGNINYYNLLEWNLDKIIKSIKV